VYFRDVPEDVASALNFAQMESAMCKVRKRIGCSSIPKDYNELADEVKRQKDKFDNVYGESFLSGVVGEGEESAIIFIIKQMKELLASSEELHIDGTFKCVPKKPKSMQLCTIMTVYEGQVSFITFRCYAVAMLLESKL
jgi:hypothetical protein